MGLATVDEGKFVSAQANGRVELWDINSSADFSVTAFLGHGLGVMSITKLDQNLVVSGGYDQTIKVWDLRKKGPSIMNFESLTTVKHVKALGTTAFVSASIDSVKLWDVRKPEGVKLIDNSDNIKPLFSSCVISGEDKTVSKTLIEYSGEFVQGIEPLDGQRLLINDMEKLQLWDLSKDQTSPKKTLENWDAVSMTQLGENQVLAGCQDGVAKFVDLEQPSGKECLVKLESSSSKYCKNVTCVARLGDSILTGHSLYLGGFFKWDRKTDVSIL